MPDTEDDDEVFLRRFIGLGAAATAAADETLPDDVRQLVADLGQGIADRLRAAEAQQTEEDTPGPG
ncbi:hypothetical protein [Streptomyces clavuligerus]|uniref:hypothetical protein n=1 Tax=Streptomyces clavuligerus TaxID=1901 RepID=UPI00017FFC7E|nr:hypothetical protein [Streptomyces clavuligerus]EDY49975.1 hypothetical protein SSCG_03229 [Streptomyces clavuligerus]MBY6307763.1 hypothetical protein [Streptomyces clavuligerus]QCS09692.1 hypothetical protein CRV15_29090 [Streptomyces clavuligerus]QPJ98266.1 hypothetical protein GE265_35285 [Streptomyces clavuligerus]WDN56397.1 hypothetical protein LL058_31640 [Streptomyces clavuligerus]